LFGLSAKTGVWRWRNGLKGLGFGRAGLGGYLDSIELRLAHRWMISIAVSGGSALE
ncbi:MAG: hypothetical protein ACI9MB_004376, partial [Verrucomicrobiales bacterium]